MTMRLGRHLTALGKAAALSISTMVLTAPALAQSEAAHPLRVGPADSLFEHLEAQQWVMHDAAVWPNGAIVMLYCHDETGMGAMIVVLPIEVEGRQIAAMYSPGRGLCELEGEPS